MVRQRDRRNHGLWRKRDQGQDSKCAGVVGNPENAVHKRLVRLRQFRLTVGLSIRSSADGVNVQNHVIRFDSEVDAALVRLHQTHSTRILTALPHYQC